MNFEILNGTLCIVDHGELIVSDITGYLKHPGNHYNVLTVSAEGSWMIKENIASCDNLTIESSPLDDGIPHEKNTFFLLVLVLCPTIPCVLLYLL